VYAGFPTDALDLLRCERDRGRLEIAGSDPAPDRLWNAAIHCTLCGSRYDVKDGILRLLDTTLLDAESDHERTTRDAELDAAFNPDVEQSDFQLAEIEPTLAASEPLRGASLLELGAGTGRYTIPLAQRGAVILAIDFSMSSLRRLVPRLHGSWRVALVQADCTRLATRPGAFDVVFSTLVSNLPSVEHRSAMMRLAAEALAPTGKFVFSTHHYGLNSRLRQERQSDRYTPGGIYRYLFRRAELARETRGYFSDVNCRPIQVVPPLTWRLRLPIRRVSRIAQRVPVLNLFGELLLVVATRPRHTGTAAVTG
jgi:2-polyprenyl-3-methyl-5-hydroxy-6-metoxy-1,4-benzoquinol methylase